MWPAWNRLDQETALGLEAFRRSLTDTQAQVDSILRRSDILASYLMMQADLGASLRHLGTPGLSIGGGLSRSHSAKDLPLC